MISELSSQATEWAPSDGACGLHLCATAQRERLTRRPRLTLRCIGRYGASREGRVVAHLYVDPKHPELPNCAALFFRVSRLFTPKL